MINAIKRVKIENFQSHKDTVLEFINGLNVIMGPSDQGKSAILRAIKWVLYNEPRGMEFIRHGSSTARVSLEFSNGNTVIRERSKSKNRYTVIDNEGKESIFEGFGNEIPEEVIKTHGIPKIQLDSDISSSLNIGDQLEGPFLLSESGSVRAKAIGRLTGLHIIDKALRDCSIDLRREAQTGERHKKELEELNERISAFDSLERIKNTIDYTGGIIRLLESLAEKRNILENKKKALEEVRESHYQAESIMKKTHMLSETEISIKKAVALKTRFEKLVELQRKIGSLNIEIQTAERLLNKTDNLGMLQQSLEKVQKLSGKLEALSTLSVRLNLILNEITESQSYIKNTAVIHEKEKTIDKINDDIKKFKDYSDLLQRYNIISNHLSEGNKYLEKNINDTDVLLKEYSIALKKAGKCPLCKSEINESVIDEVIKHYREVHENGGL